MKRKACSLAIGMMTEKRKRFNFQYREERFRQTSESTNQRVLWWSLGQTCILVIMGENY